MFRPSIILRELVLNLAKVIFMLKHSVKFRRYTELFRSPSGISELDCVTTKTDTAERNISIGRESLQVFFLY